MKHLHKSAFLALSILLAAACSKEKQQPAPKDKAIYKITVSLPETAETKVSINQGAEAMNLAWQEGDKITVIGDQAHIFTLSSGAGTKVAEFTGEEVTGSSFTVIYPGTYTSLSAIKERSYIDQTQNGNGNTAHLSFNAVASGLSSYSNVTFGEESLRNGVLKFNIKLPQGVSVLDKLYIRTQPDIFYTTNDENNTTNELSLKLSGVDVSSNGQILTAYMMTSWQSVAVNEGVEFEVGITSGKNTYSKVFIPGQKNLHGGKVNVIKLNDENWKKTTALSGEGTAERPYELYDCDDLLAISSYLKPEAKIFFMLMNDIDMTPIEEWTPLNYASPYALGIDFNGRGNKISNLKSTQSDYSSFFGVLYGSCYDVNFSEAYIEGGKGRTCGIIGGYIGTDGRPAIVENVNASGKVKLNAGTSEVPVGGLCGVLKEGKIDGCTTDIAVINETNNARAATGGIAGKTMTGTDRIRNCKVKGSVKSLTGKYTGGVIGRQAVSGTEVSGCTVNAEITGTAERVGGIAGHFQGGRISNCIVTGNINGNSGLVGGIAAVIANKSDVTGCKFTGNLSSEGNDIGGIVGLTENELSLNNCHFSGKIIAKNNVGGIVGQTKENKITQIAQCSSTGNINAQGATGGIVGLFKKCNGSKIENSYSAGNITISGQVVGGIVGELMQNVIVYACYSSAKITGWQGCGGIVGRAAGGNWNGSQLNHDNIVTSCISWNEGIEATRKNANGGSSGAIIGFGGIKNTYLDGKRRYDLVFNGSWTDVGLLTDQPNTSPEEPLSVGISGNPYDPVAYSYIYPYHGISAPEGATCSSVASSLGWNSTIWDLSNPMPVLIP